jgi:predicted kinase
MLIIVCGLPGSGKSTLARALCRRFSAIHISSDRTRKALFPEPRYTATEKARVYDEMAAAVRKALEAGQDAVLDATFYSRALRERFVRLARESGSPFRIILCTLPEDEVRRRLSRRRKGGLSDADFSVYLRLRDSFEPIEGRHLELDSRMHIGKRLRLVERFMGEG